MAQSDVNATARHAYRARERVNGNTGRLQDVEQEPNVSFWERIKNLFPQPEVLDVFGRVVRGFVIPGWAAGVLLAAILGSVGVMYSKISEQRDMLIRLDTQLQERDKHELEYRAEFKTKLNVQQLQIDNMTNRLGEIKVLLTPRQLQMMERTRKVTQ